MGRIGAGVSFTNVDVPIQFIDVKENPLPPPAGKVLLYTKIDTQTGKTQLFVLFPSGSSQILATEP